MRPSPRNIQLIEAYLSGRLSPEDQKGFQQRLVLDSQLFDRVRQQEYTYRLVHLSGRRRLRRELDQIHRELFNARGNRSWKKRILQYFDTTILRYIAAS